jgi:chromosome segregation ATPase
LVCAQFTQADIAEIDRLTERWLNTEAQSRQIEKEWHTQKPILEQRISLLRAGKEQMQAMLKENKRDRSDVDEKREQLLSEQAQLEKQQADLQSALTLVLARVNEMKALVPNLIAENWDHEDTALDSNAEASMQLQVALAKLSQLADFNDQVSIHEARMLTKDNREFVAKQFYLGVGIAWFSNSDASLSGWGQADEDGWQWHFDSSVDGNEVNHAIAIFEKKAQAEFVNLPITLSN